MFVFIHKIFIQVLIVSGGYDNWSDGNNLDTTETFDTVVGSWVTSGAKLPRALSGLKAAKIDDRVLLFGNFPPASAGGN